MATDLVIILSSDWIGSTRARAQLGEDTADAVQEVHDTLLRRGIAAEDGTVVKHYGDGVLATFHSATAALAAAMRIQAEFAAYRGSGDALTGLEVRVGLSAGDVKHQGGDIFGLPVVEAVRLQGAAGPNEILCSELVRVLSQGRGGFEFEAAGDLEFKGLPAPVTAWKVRRPDTPMPYSAPPVPAAAELARGSPPPHEPMPRAIPGVAGLILALVLVLIAAYWLQQAGEAPLSPPATPPTEAVAKTPGPSATPPTAPARLPNSVAVLPFENLSPNPDDAYFALGLHEEVLYQLARVRALNVIAGTTMRQYNNTTKPLRQVAEELNVETVMEGSVRYAGDRVRVTAQLIDPATGAHLWSEIYEHEFKDIFAIESDIALKVANALKTEFSRAERSSIESIPTQSLEAYEHFLRGIIRAQSNTLDDLRAEAEEFRRAVAIDSGYARAWAGLAVALSAVLTTTPSDAMQREREEATRRALMIAPNLPLTLAAKMWLHADHREWVPADEACARVFAAAPEPIPEWLCGAFLTMTGRVRAGLPHRERARRGDPLSMLVATTLQRQYALLDMDEELAHEYERTRDLQGGGRWSLGGTEYFMLVHLMHKGAPANAIAERLERACALSDAPPHCPDLLAASRSPGEAEAVLRGLFDSVNETNPNACLDVALWAAYFSDRELTLDALEAFSRNAVSLALQNLWFPLLSDARRDPRFKSIVRDIGLVDLWRTTGQWADVCRPVGEDDFECE